MKKISPPSKLVPIKLVTSMATLFWCKIYKMNVKSAFIDDNLEEKVSAQGFHHANKKHWVCAPIKLFPIETGSKSLVYKILPIPYTRSGFKRAPFNPNFYVRNMDDDFSNCNGLSR